jgi:hypothetical protein
MKFFIISVFLISSVGFIIPQAFSAGENFFYGATTFERIPTSIVPNNPAKFEIKFHYTAGSYTLDDLSPVIEVSPEGAKSKVHFDVKPVSAYQNDIVRIPVTITVDPDMEYEKIFLSISYVGISFNKVPFKSSWSDSIIFDIEHTNSESDSGDTDSSQGIFGPPVIEIPKLLSPLKQFESGVLVDEISCKEDLVLITKARNGNPACVKPETKIKLIERGWDACPKLSDYMRGALCGFHSSTDGGASNSTYSKEITILSISPKNVTLPDPKPKTPAKHDGLTQE